MKDPYQIHIGIHRRPAVPPHKIHVDPYRNPWGTRTHLHIFQIKYLHVGSAVNTFTHIANEILTFSNNLYPGHICVYVK